MNKSKNDPRICMCMGVTKSRIERAIESGCNTLPKIFDATGAGVGPCGGSCRPLLKRMLDHYQKTGEFLENVRDPRKRHK